MICPINTKDLTGEKKAGAILKALAPSLPTQDELQQKLRMELTFRRKDLNDNYPISHMTDQEALRYLTNLFKGYSGQLYKNIGGKTYATDIIKPKPDSSLFIEAILDRLRDKFDIDYTIINDKSEVFKGKYENVNGSKRIIINTAYATVDTPFHEYLHPFVRIIKNTDEQLYNKLVQESSFVNNKDPEERVVTMLGKAMASKYQPTLIRKVLDVISDIINSIFNTSIRFDRSTTANNLINFIVNSDSIDVSSENTLDEAYQLIDFIDSTTDKFTNKDADDMLFDKLKQVSSEFTTDDSSDYYSYKDQKYRRATSFASSKTNGQFTFIFPNKKSKDANFRASELFKKNKVEKTELIELSGNKLSFDEVVDLFEQQEKQPLIRGKLIHAYIEYLLTSSSEALKKADEYASQLNEPYISLDQHPSLKSLIEDFDAIKEMAGITISDSGTKYDDKIASEIVLFSDILKDENGDKLATTADLLVQKYNSDIGLVDFKSGHITSNWNTALMMKYGESLGIKDSKLSHAFLELALRAIMIKEKNPDQKFSFLRIVKVDKYGNHEVFDADIAPYLQIISKFYKENNPEVLKLLEDNKLLDPKSYYGVSSASQQILKDIKGLSKQEAIEVIQARLDSIYATPHKGKMPEYLQEQINQLTEARIELEGFTNIKVDFTRDKNALSAPLANLSDVDQKAVKGLNSIIIEARDREAEKRTKIYAQWDKLLTEFYKTRPEYGSKTNQILQGAATVGILYGVTATSLPILGVALASTIVIRRLNQSTKSVFDFMFVESTDEENPGVFLNTSDTYNGRNLTKQEKDLRDFFSDTLSSLYKDTMGITVTDNFGKNVTKAQLMGLPNELPENFFPRLPKTLDETREDVDAIKDLLGIKSYLEYAVKSNIVSVFERNSMSNQKPSIYHPIRYYHHSGSKVVASKMHSFNADLAFKAMVDNLVHKQYFDPIYPVAQGVVGIVEEIKNPDGTLGLPNILKTLVSQIDMQVRKQDKEASFKTSPLLYKIGPLESRILGVPQATYELNQDKILRGIKTGLGFTTMAFKSASAIKNFFIITLTNSISLTNKYAGKLIGIDNDDDLASSAAKAILDMNLYWKDYMTFNINNNKLHLISKRFDWMPDNSHYGKAQNNLLIDLTKPSIGGTAYMFHNFVETYGALTYLSAHLRSMKIKVGDSYKSAYDLYEVENGELVWKGPERGVDESGQLISELTAKEIKSLKRGYERTQGGYRPEERAAIEHTIMGQFVMQFKKYFYTFVKNQFMSRMTDPTIGRYVIDKTIQRPDGVPVMVWEQQVMVGRLTSLAGAIMALSKGNISEYMTDKSNKRAISELVATTSFLTLMLILYGISDDDDEVTVRDKMFKDIVTDSSSGLHWKDYLSTASSPIVALSRASQIAKGFLQIAGLEGDHSTDSKSRRTVKQGYRSLEKSLPILSGKKAFTELWTNSKSEDSFIDNLISQQKR